MACIRPECRSRPDRHRSEIIEEARQTVGDQFDDLPARLLGRGGGIAVVTGIVSLKDGRPCRAYLADRIGILSGGDPRLQRSQFEWRRTALYRRAQSGVFANDCKHQGRFEFAGMAEAPEPSVEEI